MQNILLLLATKWRCKQPCLIIPVTKYSPNTGQKYLQETVDGINVHRSSIYVSSSTGMIKRLMNYFSFVTSSWYSAGKRLQPYDIIICESPPLFLGITAVMLKRKWKCKLVFNVSDLWPESAEKMGIIKTVLSSTALTGWLTGSIKTQISSAGKQKASLKQFVRCSRKKIILVSQWYRPA